AASTPPSSPTAAWAPHSPPSPPAAPSPSPSPPTSPPPPPPPSKASPTSPPPHSSQTSANTAPPPNPTTTPRRPPPTPTPPPPTPAAPAIEGIAYFTTSELLQNISKHSHATQAHVDLWRTDHRLLIHVQDNGHGGATATTGSGLAGLAERLHSVDG